MNKNQKTKVKKENLLSKIERLDKKLDLFNILGRAMPAVILSSGSILGTIVFLLSVATVPEVTSLPETGEETSITEDFVILYPENYTYTTLPDDVVGLSTEGFYDDLTRVVFFAQKEDGKIVEIGEGQKGSENGEYRTVWSDTTAGKYYLWAKIIYESGVEYKSTSVIVQIH